MKISPAPAQGWLVRFSTMRRFRAQFFITAAVCQANYCRGWIPTRFSSLSLATRSTATCNTHAIISRHPQQHCNLWTNRRTCATIRSSNSRSSARLRRRRTSLAYKKDGDDDDDDDDDDGIAEESWDPRKMDSGGVLPRVKMGETPLPDYIVDMLRKSGDVDKDGKPVNDPFDPWDVEDMEGSRRIRDRENEAESEYFDVPYGEMLFADGKMNLDDQDGLMDTTIADAAMLYGFPLEFFHDVLTRWGVSPPINEHIRLGDIIDAEQAFGLGEALTGLDPADVRDNYLDETLEDIAIELEMCLPDIFQACATLKINIPQGANTHITVEEYKTLLDNVIEGGKSSDARRLLDQNLLSNRYSGLKRSGTSTVEQAMHEARLEKYSRGIGWKNGPPEVGMLEGQLPPDEIQITGRIFGEDLFLRAGQAESDGDADLFDFDGGGGD